MSVILSLRDVTDHVPLQESLRRSEVMATLGAVLAQASPTKCGTRSSA